MDMSRRVLAEFFGTFWLVLGGCGAAVLAAGVPNLGIGFVGVALAFGLTVLTMAYAVGHISGGHFNPAVTIGLWSAGRCAAADVIPYIVAHVIAAIAAPGVFWLAPILGAVFAGLLARWMYEREALIETVVIEETRISEPAVPLSR